MCSAGDRASLVSHTSTQGPRGQLPRLSLLPSPAPHVVLQVELARSFGRGRGGPPPPPRSSRRYDEPPSRGGGYGGGSGGGSSYATAPKSSGYRVIVTGLPKSASWQDLKDHFRRVGEVTFTQARLSRFLVEHALEAVASHLPPGRI